MGANGFALLRLVLGRDFTMIRDMTFRATRRLRLPILGMWLSLGLAASAGLAAPPFSFFEPVQPPRALQVVAPGGAGRQAPSHTRPALEHCIADQLEWAVVVVRRTRDGRHVLAPSASVIDTNGATFKINKTDWATLCRVDVGTAFAERFRGTTLLALEDGFAICRGRLNLLLDGRAADVAQLVREIADARMEAQVVVYLDAKKCRQVRRLGGGKIATMTRWRPALGGADWAVKNGLTTVAIAAPDLTSESVAAFHRADIKVLAKMVGSWDQPDFWERAMVAGVDWLQTDVPEEVLAHALWRRVTQRPVQISLHRGAGRYAPENTMPAFEKAIRLGVDYVEFDVRATRDGGHFLLHDARLDRTTDGVGPISEATTAMVQALDAGVKFSRAFVQTPVPSFEQFMVTFSGRVNFYFDAKQIPADLVASSLKAQGMIERTVIYQSPQFIAQLQALNPVLRGLPPLRRVEQLEAVARLKPYAVDVDWKILSPELIARCHALGIKVFSDALGEFERVEAYLRAMEWGIDLIQTDYPLRVMRAIELWSGRRAQTDK